MDVETLHAISNEYLEKLVNKIVSRGGSVDDFTKVVGYIIACTVPIEETKRSESFENYMAYISNYARQFYEVRTNG